DVLLDLFALADDVVSQRLAAAAVGFQQTAEHPDKGCFAAAVGPEEAIDFAAAHLHGDVVDHGAVAEPLRHPLHVDDEFAVHCALPSRYTSTGWPGCSVRATSGGKLISTMNDSFCRICWL